VTKKGFLYTGIVFLVMVGILISANYLFLSTHNKEQSKIMNMELDSSYNLEFDTKEVLALSPNNTIADALSDVAFMAVLVGGTPTDICNRLDPTNIASETSRTNMTKWVSNYTNLTFSEITAMTGMNFSSLVIKPSSSKSLSGSRCTVIYSVNMSYFLTKRSSFYLWLNQSLSSNKTLEVNVVGSVYYISVKNGSRFDFNRSVTCSGTPRACLQN